VALIVLSNGTLTPAGMFSTGGSGNPVAQPGDPPTDPLASQGSLILSEDNDFLFAVNAGSNEISVLAIGKDGLMLVDKVASGGIRPISLTVHENLLYVLNEGGTPNITGFTVSDEGQLSPLAGSTRPLAGGSAADPAEVRFSPDGELLTVTEKASNLIDTYTVWGRRSGRWAYRESFKWYDTFRLRLRQSRARDRLRSFRRRAQLGRSVIARCFCERDLERHQRVGARLSDCGLLDSDHQQRAIRLHDEHRQRLCLKL
jgi:Lactonase, 7-bladed beta-propeller